MWRKSGWTYLLVIFLQQSRCQVCCSTQFILKNKNNKKKTLEISLCARASASLCLWRMSLPVHRKSSAWLDTAACSSWRQLQYPPQTLSAKNGSSYKPLDIKIRNIGDSRYNLIMTPQSRARGSVLVTVISEHLCLYRNLTLNTRFRFKLLQKRNDVLRL